MIFPLKLVQLAVLRINKGFFQKLNGNLSPELRFYGLTI